MRSYPCPKPATGKDMMLPLKSCSTIVILCDFIIDCQIHFIGKTALDIRCSFFQFFGLVRRFFLPFGRNQLIFKIRFFIGFRLVPLWGRQAKSRPLRGLILVPFSQTKIKDARMIQETIFIDLGYFLSFIHQSFRFLSVYRFPKVALMKKNTKVISL